MLSRNAESHFAKIPTINAPRSIFDRSHEHIGSCNIGELVPIFCEEVYPGDSFRVKSSKVIRLQTMLTPIYGNMYADFYYFWIPNNILWTNFRAFMGENTQSAWVPSTQYSVPTISSPQNGFAVGTIADHLGWPVNVQWSNSDEQAPVALPLRAYAMVCDSFFRDQNLTDPLNIPLGDANQTGTNGGSYINDVANGGKPFLAAKYHDYFTSCLPSPQKAAQPVTFPLISGSSAPVYPTKDNTPYNTDWRNLAWKHIDGTGLSAVPSGYHNLEVYSTGTGDSSTGTSSAVGSGWAQEGIVPTNLWADLTTSVGSVTVNELRLAFQLQRYYERLAMSGSRYVEQIKAFFNVSCPDSLLYRPEYLGGNRVPLNITSVTNTAQTANDFLGDLGAKSETADIHADFERSFDQHGWILGVMVVRYQHVYSQGLEKKFKRKSVTDFYNPIFQTLGSQPVFTDELYADATNMATADVFGYQEAWSELRYSKNYITGEMRPGIPNSLASWHLGDYYTQAPTLSDAWIREDKTNVDRVLAVTSSVSNQVFYDIWFQNIATRCLPIYSVPGLIDHH